MATLAAPLIGGLVSGLAGLFGGGPQKTATQQTTNSSNSSNGTSSSSVNPNLSAEQQQLSNTYGEGLLNQYNQGTDLSGYKASGLQQINNTSNAAKKATDNMIASRGQSFSPAGATADIAQNINSGNQQSSFLNSIPLLQKQLQSQNLSQLIQGFSALPTAVSSNGTSSNNSTGTSTTTGNGSLVAPGGQLGGAIAGIGSGLAVGYPSLAGSLGAQNGGQNSGYGAPGVNGQPGTDLGDW